MDSNYMTAAQIDAWITRRYGQLKQRVMMTCYFDEDVFQDTYLSLRETGVQSRDLEASFIRLYRTLLSRDYGREIRYIHPDPLYFALLHDEEEQAEASPKAVTVGSAQVENACRSLLNSEEYTLFNLRYKLGLALRDKAAYTGRSTRTIMQKLNSIIERLRAYFCPVRASLAV